MVGVLGTSPMSVHQALTFTQWNRNLLFFGHELELTAEDRERLEAAGVTLVDGTAAGLETTDGRLTGVTLDDARVVEVDALVVTTRMRARAGAFTRLGATTTAHPAGEFIEADGTGRTAVAGVWAAVNVSDLSAQVGPAAADRTRAAQDINADLVMTDLAATMGKAAHQRQDRTPSAASEAEGSFGDTSHFVSYGQPQDHK